MHTLWLIGSCRLLAPRSPTYWLQLQHNCCRRRATQTERSVVRAIKENAVTLSSYFRENAHGTRVRRTEREAVLRAGENRGRVGELKSTRKIRGICRIRGAGDEVLFLPERRPGDVNVHQAESLAGAAKKAVIYHSDVFQMKPDGILLERKCAIWHLRGPEEARGKDGGVKLVKLRSRTGIEQVNSYHDEGAAVVLSVRGQILALHDPEIGCYRESVSHGVCGRAS